MTTLTVARRFRGPRAFANGGYACGAIAAHAAAPVTVRLLRPVPLETALSVVERGGQIELTLDGETLARTRPGDVDELVPPPAPGAAEAAEASRGGADTHRHPAPECFVCGPRREPGDGLRLFAGPPRDDGVVAAPWVPDPSLDAGDGCVGAELIWAALDCPGFQAVAPDMRAMLLGEMTARVERRVRVGESCVVVGWKIAASGRKHEAGTALFDADARLCGRARAVWIEPRYPS